MDTCRRISTILSAARDRPLTMGERLLAGVHLLYCRPCRRFKAQVETLHRAARSLVEHEPDPAGPTLDPEARRRIGRALRQ